MEMETIRMIFEAFGLVGAAITFVSKGKLYIQRSKIMISYFAVLVALQNGEFAVLEIIVLSLISFFS